MGIKKVTKWMVGLIAAGALLLLVSIFVADRRLAPPFDEAELGPIEVPVGDPLSTSAILFSSDRTGNFELYAREFEGGEPLQLTNDPDLDSWRPRLSPDRATILFYRTPAGVGDSDSSRSSLWMVTAQGGALTEVLPQRAHGWTRQGHAEWSPTGGELVMMGERPAGHQIWITTPDGRAVRSLVSDPGDNTDPSWAPDGQRVLYAACPESPCVSNEREIFTVLSAGGERIQITNDDIADNQPRFSPDGSQIVMRSQVVAGDDDGVGEVWDIRVVPTNRSSEPQRLVGDDSVSGAPVWIGLQTVMFHRTEQGRGDADIMAIQLVPPMTTVIVESAADELYPAS